MKVYFTKFITQKNSNTIKNSKNSKKCNKLYNYVSIFTEYFIKNTQKTSEISTFLQYFFMYYIQ